MKPGLECDQPEPHVHQHGQLHSSILPFASRFTPCWGYLLLTPRSIHIFVILSFYSNWNFLFSQLYSAPQSQPLPLSLSTHVLPHYHVLIAALAALKQ